MNIDFELYRVFYVVAKKSNITKASEELHISQPAISKSIKNLEQQLGGKLFTRTKKGVVLTEEGKEFYNYISKAIEYINNAENKFSSLINLESGTIRIGVSATLTKTFLLPYLEKFHSIYPNINIQIDTSLTSELITKLRNGLIDIVILNLTNETLNDIKYIKCKMIHDIFACNIKYKELIDKEVSLKDLNNYPLILQPKETNTRIFLDKFTEEHNTSLKPSMEIASYSLVSSFAKIGLGIGYLTKEYIKKELEDNKLYEIKLKEKIPPRYIGIAYSTKNTPNFATKRMINLLQRKDS